MATGLCINANGAVPDRAECAALGLSSGDWVRTAVQGSLSLVATMLDALPPDISVMVTLNNECAEVRGDWGGWENACRMLANIASIYPGRIKVLGAGNELDLWHLQPPVGVPDPRLTPAFAADLVKRAAPIMRVAGIKVALTSVASGRWFNYLQDAASQCVGSADYADLHLYMKQVNGVPGDPNWQNADAAILQAENASGLPVICSEAGIKVDDAGGISKQAQWAEGLSTLSADLVCYWCWSDRMASPGETGGQAFGARGLDGQKKPVWSTLQRLFGGPVAAPPAEQHGDVQWAFQEGFLAWSQVQGDLLGKPDEPSEHGGIAGFSQLRTTRGILTWADLKQGEVFTFFDDGSRKRYRWQKGWGQAVEM